MYTIHASPRFTKEFRKLSATNHKLTNRVDKQLQTLINNPTHPSLHIHKLTGDLDQVWSISVTRSLRISFHFAGSSIILHDIGTHDQLYRRKT